ncbi:hypothetical protein AAFF_G00365270 [Aldrovandia affinis]|uniref:Uncharacterized protein n=1 Tax=Aldrovandia affinis TaxID=143900 RepID=A0AAD7R5C3_9TELE|nr:hypothetical protein AAFF_G00365270 [Aldrovandia affinis]
MRTILLLFDLQLKRLQFARSFQIVVVHLPAGETMTEKFGGWGPILPATPEVQDLCNKLLPQIEKKVDTNLKDLTALKYRLQSLGGGQDYRILAKSVDHYLLINIGVIKVLPTPPVAELIGAEFLPTEENPQKNGGVIKQCPFSPVCSN